MDYKNIYYKIIENAKNETENGNRCIGYFEKHHILPKSLGGSNDKENLVKLTAREHFVCHLLLVKMHNKGTNERNKMLYAFWRMQSSNEYQKRYVNSHAYEVFKIEFANVIGNMTSIKQTGEKNSQFGKKWYTNRDTGESKSFFEKPNSKWIEGRNLFAGQTSKLLCKYKFKTNCEYMSRIEYFAKRTEYYSEYAKHLWNKFHSGNYKSLREYAKLTNVNLTKFFENYIPIFKQIQQGKHYKFKSNKDLVNRYT